MAQSRWISQPIQNLCHTYLATVHLFDTEIAGGQGSIDSVFNRGGFNQFVNVVDVDDVFVVVTGTPRAGIDFTNNELLHFLQQFVEIITKQVV